MVFVINVFVHEQLCGIRGYFSACRKLPEDSMFSLIREIPWFLPRPLIENSTGVGDKKLDRQNPAVSCHVSGWTEDCCQAGQHCLKLEAGDRGQGPGQGRRQSGIPTTPS